jgi:predicted RNA-binding Zn-ribbon protein involved in translation (DUF1610 family)
LAYHHSYVEVLCPDCGKTRIARKDVIAKAKKENKILKCKKCAMRSRPVTWKKSEEELCKNQGAYSSYTRAKRRVATNHNNSYSHVEFRFDSYKQFLDELGPRPDGMTLDRIDVNGHYEPGNVRWATYSEQTRNKKNNIFVNFNDQRMCLKDAAKASGIDRGTIKRRMEKGYPEAMWFIKGKINYEMPAQ